MAKKPTRVTRAELEAEGAVALPAKEVISLLNLNVDLDLALDLAAPIDLAVAANANIAAPIDAAVSANVLSLDSAATAASTQQVLIDQHISGEAIASAPQEAIVDQSNDVVDGGTTDTTGTADTGTAAATPTLTDGVTDVVDGGTINDTIDDVTGNVTGIVEGANSLLEGGLLNVDVKATLDADLAAPIAGAVAANANVAAPIDASVAANIGSIGSEAIAVANQTAVINQSLDGVVAEATAAQTAEVTQ
jgi:hypothetical protein